MIRLVQGSNRLSELTVITSSSYRDYTSSIFNLKKDNMTSWNSWYTMLDWVLLRTNDAITQYASSEKRPRCRYTQWWGLDIIEAYHTSVALFMMSQKRLKEHTPSSKTYCYRWISCFSIMRRISDDEWPIFSRRKLHLPTGGYDDWSKLCY